MCVLDTNVVPPGDASPSPSTNFSHNSSLNDYAGVPTSVCKPECLSSFHEPTTCSANGNSDVNTPIVQQSPINCSIEMTSEHITMKPYPNNDDHISSQCTNTDASISNENADSNNESCQVETPNKEPIIETIKQDTEPIIESLPEPHAVNEDTANSESKSTIEELKEVPDEQISYPLTHFSHKRPCEESTSSETHNPNNDRKSIKHTGSDHETNTKLIENYANLHNEMDNTNRKPIPDDMETKANSQIMNSTSTEAQPPNSIEVPGITIESAHEVTPLHGSNTINDSRSITCIPLIHKSNNTYVKGLIEGLPVFCLVDTGASMSIISSNFWLSSNELSKLSLLAKYIDLHARIVKGASLQIMGKLDVTFSLGDSNCPFQPYVVENFVHDVLIGRDFLQYFNSKIDFQNGTLEMTARPFNPSGLIDNDTTQPEYVDEEDTDYPRKYAQCDVCYPSNDVNCDIEQSSSYNDDDDDVYVVATITDHVYPSQNREGNPKVHLHDNDNCDALLDSQLVPDGLVDAPSKSLHLPNADLENVQEVTPTDSPPPNVDFENTKEIIPTDSLLPSRLDSQTDKKKDCHFNSLLECICHFTAINNRAFSSILRLNEIQGMVSQLTRLRQKELVRYAHFPPFLMQQLSRKLQAGRSIYEF